MTDPELIESERTVIPDAGSVLPAGIGTRGDEASSTTKASFEAKRRRLLGDNRSRAKLRTKLRIAGAELEGLRVQLGGEPDPLAGQELERALSIHSWGSRAPEDGGDGSEPTGEVPGRLEFLLENVDSSVGPHVASCYNHLAVAERATDTGIEDEAEDIPSAYQGLFAARRELIYLRHFATGDDEPTRNPFVRREGMKVVTRARSELYGGPLETIEKLLTADDSSKLKEDLQINDVVEAQQVYDEEALRRVETSDVLERQHRTFMKNAKRSGYAIIGLVIVAPYLVSLLNWLSGLWLFDGFESGAAKFGIFGDLSAQYGATMFVAVALFGLLGASISGLFTLRGVSSASRSTIDLDTLAEARLATGVGSALVVVMLVESGVLELFLTFDVGFSSPTMALVVAFLAGFSERFLLRAMNRVIGEEESKLERSSYDNLRRSGAARSPDASGEQSTG